MQRHLPRAQSGSTDRLPSTCRTLQQSKPAQQRQRVQHMHNMPITSQGSAQWTGTCRKDQHMQESPAHAGKSSTCTRVQHAEKSSTCRKDQHMQKRPAGMEIRHTVACRRGQHQQKAQHRQQSHTVRPHTVLPVQHCLICRVKQTCLCAC
jgi:hypothetical protein